MKTIVRQGLILFGLLTLLTGIVYPLAVTGLAQFFFPHQANGSLVVRDGHVIGSEWLAQKFTANHYFHSRPSAGDYATVPSGASNLGPASRALRDAMMARAAAVRRENHVAATVTVPPDLLTSSGSGLDPHLSPAAVRLQIERVAQARGFTPEQRTRLEHLVAAMTEPPQWGLLGEPRVNVLNLNLELDQL